MLRSTRPRRSLPQPVCRFLNGVGEGWEHDLVSLSPAPALHERTHTERNIVEHSWTPNRHAVRGALHSSTPGALQAPLGVRNTLYASLTLLSGTRSRHRSWRPPWTRRSRAWRRGAWRAACTSSASRGPCPRCWRGEGTRRLKGQSWRLWSLLTLEVMVVAVVALLLPLLLLAVGSDGGGYCLRRRSATGACLWNQIYCCGFHAPFVPSARSARGNRWRVGDPCWHCPNHRVHRPFTRRVAREVMIHLRGGNRFDIETAARQIYCSARSSWIFSLINRTRSGLSHYLGSFSFVSSLLSLPLLLLPPRL